MSPVALAVAARGVRRAARRGDDDWRVLYHVVSAHFRTSSFAKGVAFIGEILDGPRIDQHVPRSTMPLTALRRDSTFPPKSQMYVNDSYFAEVALDN